MNTHADLSEQNNRAVNRLGWLNSVEAAFKGKKIDYAAEIKKIGESAYSHKRIAGVPVSIGFPNLGKTNASPPDAKVFESLVGTSAKNYLKFIKEHFRGLYRLLSFEYRQIQNLHFARWQAGEIDQRMPAHKIIDFQGGRPFVPNVTGNFALSNIIEADVILNSAKSRYLIFKAYLDALSRKCLLPELTLAEVVLIQRWHPEFLLSDLLPNQLNPKNHAKEEDDIETELNRVFKPNYLSSLIQHEEGVDLEVATQLDHLFVRAMSELSEWRTLPEENKAKLAGALFSISTLTLSKHLLITAIYLEPNIAPYLRGVIFYDQDYYNTSSTFNQLEASDSSLNYLGRKMVVPLDSGQGFHPLYADLIKVNQLLADHIDCDLQSENLDHVRKIITYWDELSTHSFRRLVQLIESEFECHLAGLESLQEEYIKPTGIGIIKTDRLKGWISSLKPINGWASKKLEPTAESIILQHLKDHLARLDDLSASAAEPYLKLSKIHEAINAFTQEQPLKDKLEVIKGAEDLLAKATEQINLFNEFLEKNFSSLSAIEQLARLPELQDHFKPEDAELSNDKKEAVEGNKSKVADHDIEELLEITIEEVESLKSALNESKQENLKLRQHNNQLLNGLSKDPMVKPQWQPAKIAFEALVAEGVSASTIVSTCQSMFDGRLFFFDHVTEALQKLDRQNLPLETLAQRLFTLATDGVDLMRENGGQLHALRNIVASGISCQESEAVRSNKSLISQRSFTRSPGEMCEVLPHFALGDLHRIYLRFHEERIEIAFIGKHLPTASFGKI